MNRKLIKNIESRDRTYPSPKKKLNFKCCKNNTIKSLYEVEYFLNRLNRFVKYTKLYKILK